MGAGNRIATRLGFAATGVTRRAGGEFGIAHPHVVDAVARATDQGLELAIAIRLKRRQGAVMIEARDGAEPPGRVDRALARAWAQALAAGEVASTKELARQSGLCNHYAAKSLPLAWLPPDLVATIMQGRQPRAVSLGALMKATLPVSWDQRRLFEALG